MSWSISASGRDSPKTRLKCTNSTTSHGPSSRNSGSAIDHKNYLYWPSTLLASPWQKKTGLVLSSSKYRVFSAIATRSKITTKSIPLKKKVHCKLFRIVNGQADPEFWKIPEGIGCQALLRDIFGNFCRSQKTSLYLPVHFDSPLCQKLYSERVVQVWRSIWGTLEAAAEQFYQIFSKLKNIPPVQHFQ